jgi:hypothetical protein
LIISYELFVTCNISAFPPIEVQMREEPSLTDWDRFARREYVRLAMEEDGEDASNASGDVWDESLESPF